MSLKLTILSTILILGGVAQGGVLNDFGEFGAFDDVNALGEEAAFGVERSVLDPIIKALLQSLASKLANLTISDINEVVKTENVNATVNITDISIKNADKFVVHTLKTNIVPLKLNNLTLTWKDITASAKYNVDANISVGNLSPIHIFANGKFKAVLSDIFATIGANVELKNNAVQIKPKGLFGFDLVLKKADISFTSLMGSTELGTTVGKFFSRLIPDVVETFRKPLFDAFQDNIIVILNQILKNQKTFFMDDDFSGESFEVEDFSFPGALALDSEESESAFSNF